MRHGFQLISAIFLLAVAGIIGGSTSAQVIQRKDVADLTPAEITSLRRGVEVMKTRDTAPRDSADFRRSWVYWANVHEHFGGDCWPDHPPAQVPSGRPDYVGVSNHIAQSDIERDTWCKCEHGLPHFLTWHRMYLYYFEQVLREASGDANLRLPYWNFERNRQLPQLVRDETYVDESGATRDNPLHVPARREIYANGEPLGPQTVATAAAFRQRDFLGFSNILSGAPHGNVHCAIGTAGCPSGLMGDTRTAGLDPLFYLHHANIDRLYDCWLGTTPGTRLPSEPETLDAQYSFVDGSGAMQTRRVGDMLRSSQLGYAYSHAERCPQARRASGPGFLSSDNARRFTIAGEAILQRGVTSIPLAISQDTRQRLRSNRFLSAASTQTVLVIRNLTYDSSPQTLYEVYLVTPSNERVLTGMINFFAFGVGGHGAHGADPDQGSDVTLDISDTIGTVVNNAGDLPAGTTLEFVPSTGAADSSPEDAMADMPEAPNVRYEGVELIVIPG